MVKTEIAHPFKQRLYFLLETVLVFLGIFLFSIIYILISRVISDPLTYGIFNYIERALFLIIAIILFLYIADYAFEKRRFSLILESDISPAVNFLNLFKISKTNFKYQVLYGIIILFIVFIPLDFFTYLLAPQMISYSSEVLDANIANSYLNESYLIFLAAVIIIQFSVGTYEESLVRGFLANRGSDYVGKRSAVMISSFYFGIGHFSYLLSPSTRNMPIVFPFIWFIESLFIGIILAMLVLRKRWIFPAILAHSVNNIISAHILWNYRQGQPFEVMLIFLYLPLLSLSVIIFIWQYSRIKDGLKIGLRDFKKYFQNNVKQKEETDKKIIRIMLDLLIGLLIYVFGFFLT
jgi:membrane protease YdiL (CAAX protease family)